LPPVEPLRVRSVGELELPSLPPAHWAIFRAQSYAQHKERSLLYPSMYGRDLRLKMSRPHEPDVSSAEVTMAAWRRAYQEALRDVDILRGPVFEGAAPTVDVMLAEFATDRLETSNRLIAHTAVANALGWPAMAVPTEDGFAHLLARPGREAELLAYAERIGRHV
jgi:Asp-tRNA(Asn)/Glu-tRNA(Gln) amidotransferase A subunit family amidase